MLELTIYSLILKVIGIADASVTFASGSLPGEGFSIYIYIFLILINLFIHTLQHIINILRPKNDNSL